MGLARYLLHLRGRKVVETLEHGRAGTLTLSGTPSLQCLQESPPPREHFLQHPTFGGFLAVRARGEGNELTDVLSTGRGRQREPALERSETKA